MMARNVVWFWLLNVMEARARSMANPSTMKSWSPYVVGIAIGVLSWFAFATVDKHLAITLQFEHIAATAQMAAADQWRRAARYQALPWYAQRPAPLAVGVRAWP